MNNWQVDLFTGLQSSTNMQDVLDVTLKCIKPFGFDYCSWRSLLPLPMAAKKIVTLNSYEDDIAAREAKGDYLDTPLSRHCAHSMEPFRWQGKTSEDWYQQIPDMAEEYFGWGRRGGWAQSLVTGTDMYSLLWVDSCDVLSLRDLEHVDFRMQWVATAVLSYMNKIKMYPDISLSLREQEILRWTGDGKTADQIAEILSLSPSTVNFHLRKAMLKLDAPNKTAAVVRAIFYGLLH